MNDLTAIVSATDYNAETTKTLCDHCKCTDTHNSPARYVVNPPGAGSTTEWLKCFDLSMSTLWQQKSQIHQEFNEQSKLLMFLVGGKEVTIEPTL